MLLQSTGDMVACICHLIFSATTHYFFKKYCVVASLSKYIILSKNIVLCAMSTTQYFLKKQCVVTNLPEHIIFSKNIVLTQKVMKILCVVTNLPQHNIF